jgi:hypothetical protein
VEEIAGLVVDRIAPPAAMEAEHLPFRRRRPPWW